MKFPKDIPKDKVIKILNRFGFEIVREGNHIAMIRDNPDGSNTPLTMPNHKKIKGSTLRTIINKANIKRDDFLDVYQGI